MSPKTRREILRWSLVTLGLLASVWAAWRYRVGISQSAKKLQTKLPELKFPEPSPSKPGGSPARPPKPQSPPKPTILPHEKDYATFLKKLDLRYISPHEILSAHRRERNGVANSLPPREYWNGMVPTLKVADELRHRLGVILRYITSAYRSPEYNAQCPGASPRSYHTKNIALDLVYDCPASVAMTEARKMRDEGLFKGGLGLYKTFIHIDTRGRNANWG